MMAPRIKTAERMIPMCYAYSTPEIARHNGWVKIGYTDKQDVTERIKQQTHTSDTLAVEEWREMQCLMMGKGLYSRLRFSSISPETGCGADCRH